MKFSLGIYKLPQKGYRIIYVRFLYFTVRRKIVNFWWWLTGQ